MNNLIFCQNRLITFLACSKLPGKKKITLLRKMTTKQPQQTWLQDEIGAGGNILRNTRVA